MESHLLQMRGLKPSLKNCLRRRNLSHLLQMRGLKLTVFGYANRQNSRIFYRCVD